MFIQTETTPNPQTLKFLPGRTVMDVGTADFRTAEAAQGSVLARALFQIDGVTGVFFGEDFVSVTKGDVQWAHIKPMILGAIMEHFTLGLPLIGEASASSAEDFDPADAEIVEQIKELLDTRVRPSVARDGGDIIFRGFEGKSGTVFLKLQGACAGCPSSTATLKNGIENLLKHYVPEVNAVESVAA
ncbi:MAG TPA: NifU family protein [Alphaproteobacteria bacterium]|nr:NifU family protein [Alphaproteobacteria bacterium]HAJ48602.1 NifU family protein [Alphaproteobacteria bacterium]